MRKPTFRAARSVGADARDLSGVDGAQLAESTRVEAFSDGVLAIVVTLLILDLKAPPGAGIGHGLARQWPAYVAYFGSFAYVGVIWVNHHYLFTRIKQVDVGLLWRNLFLLFTTSVLPFPTSVVSSAFQGGQNADQSTALVLYAAVAVTEVFSWLILFQYLSRHPELLHDAGHVRFFSAERRRSWAGITVFVICALVALVLPLAALILAAIVPFFYAATSTGTVQRRAENPSAAKGN